MKQGTLDLIILILIFLGLQVWWIIPIIRRNKDLNARGNKLNKEIKKLEKIFKKWLNQISTIYS